VAPSGGVGDSLTGEGDRWTLTEELRMYARFADETGCRVTYGYNQSHMMDPEQFTRDLETVQELLEHNRLLYPQWSGRPAGLLSSLQAYHVFQARPTCRRMAGLPLPGRVAAMRDPKVKAAILSEADLEPASRTFNDNLHLALVRLLPDTYALGDPPDYEPDPATSVVRRAEALERDVFDVVYDLLLEDDGRAVLMAIGNNYRDGDWRLTERLLRHPNVILGVGDAGAHCRLICDGSIPTTMLSYWARDRHRGPRLPLEHVVKKQTADTAELFGLDDRGTVEVGKRGDINVIDWTRLRLDPPHIVSDLPGGAERFIQDAHGYMLTTVAGVPTVRHDRDTGARPGRLVRSG
jgi:N-acyl-D-aspartate/D-glutamate deacylase